MTGTQSTTAAIVGGLAAGAAMSLAMAIGRRAGALHKTLAEDAEDWLDRVLGTRRRIGHRAPERWSRPIIWPPPLLLVLAMRSCISTYLQHQP